MNKTFIKKEETKKIVFRCDVCNAMNEQDVHINGADYDSVESHERKGMGIETLYEAELSFSCPNCENEIVLVSRVWEYPVGALNDTEIKLVGAELLQ